MQSVKTMLIVSLAIGGIALLQSSGACTLFGNS